MGDILRRHHWFHHKMMSVKRVQKFRTDDMSINPDLVVLLIGWSKLSANQTYYPYLGSERSPVWNFCPHFLYVIMQGNQLWPGEMSSVFSGCYKKGWKWLHECIFNSFYNLHPSFVKWNPPYGYLSNIVTSLLWPLFFVGYTFPYKKKPVDVNLL